MVQILSPRVISKMDRMALELETQTLCRKVDVLNKEKNTLEKAVEMYEWTLQDQERENGVVPALERDLRSVRQQLQQAKQDLVAVRQTVVADYEGKWQDHKVKLQRTQAVADKYQQDRQVLQQELDHVRQELKDTQVRYQEAESRQRTQQEAKEAALEVQLQEVADLADELKDQYEGEKEVVRQLGIKLKEELAARDREMVALTQEMEQRKLDVGDQLRVLQQDWRTKLTAKERDLTQLREEWHAAEETWRRQQAARDEAHDVQVASLQEALALQTARGTEYEMSRDEALVQVQERNVELQQCQEQCVEQSQLMKEMTERLDAVHIEYRDKFVELKEAYESKEKRRLQEMVQSHAVAVDEYERRIQTLQEQLKHQNDRHEKEREQTTLEQERAVALWTQEKEALVEAHAQSRTTWDETVSQLQLECDRWKAERSRLRTELDGLPSREDTIKERQERERRDVWRDNEITRLTEKSERLLRDLTQRNERLQDVSNQLVEMERQHAIQVKQMKHEHSDALFQREQELTEQLQQWRSNEEKSHCDWIRKEAEWVATKLLLESRVSELLDQGEEATRGLEQIRRRGEESESVLRDQMSVLEGKLRGAETILKQKSDAIDDLKERLELSTSQEVASTEAHQHEVQRLRREIKALHDQFAAEGAERKATISRLHDNLKEKSNLVSKLEGMLSVASTNGESMDQRMKEAEDACREAKAELIAERTRHVSAEEQTRVDLAILQGKFRASEASLKEKRETIEELEDQLRRIADESSTTNKELQKEVDQLRTEVKKLNEQLDKDRAELFTKSELLKQQQKKLQQNAEEIVSLHQTIAASTQSDEQRNRDMSQLKASLDQAVADLEAERVETTCTVTRLQDQLVQTVTKLNNVEATLQEKHDLLTEQQEQIRVLANDSSTTEKEYQNQLERLQRATDEQLAKLNTVIQGKEAQIEVLQSQVAELLETSSRVNELETQLSDATSAERNLKLELEAVRSELSTSMQSFEAQQSSRSVTERQLNARIAELEEKLRETSMDLEKKQAAICDLQDTAKRASDESMASFVQLKTEINSLQYDIKMSNDLLQKERTSMDAKVEEYEQLRIVNWNLRQKASRAEKLEGVVSELREALDDARAEHTDRSMESKATGRSVIDLQEKLDLERRAKEDLMTKLFETESELEIKQQQLSRLPALQAQLKQLVDEREELQARFDEVELELERKDKSRASDMSSERLATLEAELADSRNIQSQLRSQLQKVEQELQNQIESSNRSVDNHKLNANSQLVELQTKVDQLTKAKCSLEAKIREQDEDREDRERQVREASERYSNQILELQIQVEGLSRKKSSLTTRLSRLESDIEGRDEQMSVASSQISVDFANLQSTLTERIAENEALKSKVDTMQSQLLEMETAKEIQAKLDAESKEKRSLISKIGDIEAELQRKEKQIRDIVDRYTSDIAELEYKLEDEVRTRTMLEKDIEKTRRGEASSLDVESRQGRDQIQAALRAQQLANTELQNQLRQLKDEASTAMDAASEEKVLQLTKANTELQDKLQAVTISAEKTKRALEEQLDAAINNTEAFSDRVDLEATLAAVEKSKSELEERLRKVNAERTEVINALEEVISEVQSREDEIEGLATVLRKRDEELEHAKLIATKALASAQDMKARLKNKGDNELVQKIDELNLNIDFLTKKNETLERKTSRMERELQHKELECGDLRNRLQRSATKDKLNISRKLDEKLDDDGFHSINPNFQTTFDTSSPTTKASSAFAMTDSISMGSGEPPVGSTASGWLHDFDDEEEDDSDDAVSFSGIHTAPSEATSRRSIERDALRKYVRKRYMKSKA